MSDFATYNIVTGEVITTGIAPYHMIALQIRDNIGVVVDKVDSNTQYIDTNTQTVIDKEPFTLNQNKSQILADGNDEWILTDLPVGSIVTWPDGEITTVNDGEIIFSVDVEGVYMFKIDPFPYLPLEVSVEAVT